MWVGVECIMWGVRSNCVGVRSDYVVCGVWSDYVGGCEGMWVGVWSDYVGYEECIMCEV